MEEVDAAAEYRAFRDDLLREAEVSGDPQRAAFFRLYSELAAENGDCLDMVYCPIVREGARPYQVDGYALDRDRGELYIAACDFRPGRYLQKLKVDGIIAIFNRVRRFCEYSIRNDFLGKLEETSSEFELAHFIQSNSDVIKRIRCIMFSNARLATRKKTLEAKRVIGAETTFNIIDFDRFVDIRNAMDGIEPIEIDLSELNGDILPCIKAHFEESDYESYLVVMPGSLLARIYGLYGARLMEQNVRTFLQARTKANKGIIHTANEEPEMFFAYNNGITATASGVEVESGPDGGTGIAKIRDLQIVNGGQTTASLLYARDHGQADLSKVFVQLKLSVVKPERIEEVVPLISRYANTQNRVSEADFFSSHPFHREIQQISRRLAAPVAAGALSATRWFYERARGQHRNEAAARNPTDRRKFEAEFPKSQVIQKTDLAKYDLTFDARPHIVSLGAQKCFLQYAQEISKEWNQSTKRFNDKYFRHVVAKAVIFRWLDKHVGTAYWYKADRGYKANIVTYTVAWLVNYLSCQKSSALDFDLIWKLQSVPDELQACLEALAPEIAMCIKSPPSGVSNISEYAKSQACWRRVSGLQPEVPDDTASYTAKSGKARNYEVGLETLLFNNRERLSGVRQVAQHRRLLSSTSAQALKKAQNDNFRLSQSERNSLRHLFARLDKIGFGPASWTD